MTAHPDIADSDGRCVQFLGTRTGELLVVIGVGEEVQPDSEIHHKMPADGSWMYWGTVRDLWAWRPPVSSAPRADGGIQLEFPQDPELPAFDPTTGKWLLRGGPVEPMDPGIHTWRINRYPLGIGILYVLEWDR